MKNLKQKVKSAINKFAFYMGYHKESIVFYSIAWAIVAAGVLTVILS